MKTISLKFNILFLLFSLMGAGCEKDDVSQSVLDGKWILIGFGDGSTDVFRPEPDSEPKSSYVVFDNGEMVAHSVSNVVENMQYSLIEENKILFTTTGMETLIGGDTEWGLRFLTRISKVYEFEFKEDTLILYYEDQKFMKFKKETK